MIRIFEWDANRGNTADEVNASYTTNGLGLLSPTKCTVSETLNGEYELVMEHPQDELGKWKRIQRNRIIVAPVPSAPHPIMRADRSGYNTTKCQFRRLANLNGAQRLRSRPNLESDLFSTEYEPGTEFRVLSESTDDGVIEYATGTDHHLLDAESGWVFVRPANGTSGYIQDRYLRYSRTTDSGPPSAGDISTDIVIPSLQDDSTRYTIKDQAFRIYKIEKMLNSILVYARHISYDFGESYIPYVNISPELDGAWNPISQGLFYVFDTNLFIEKSSKLKWGLNSNINSSGRTVPTEWKYERKTLTEILFGEDGFVGLFGGEVCRDNNDVYWLESIGRHRGVYVRSGKNMTGITFTEDWSEVVNRIMPIGKNNDGDTLYLNGKNEITETSSKLYVTKQSIDEVPFYRTALLEDAECNTVSKLQAAADAEFSKGCDQPKITASVQFELLGESEEYAQYHKLQGIFLGDTVYAKSSMANIDVPIKMTQYTYNCLTQRYESMTLGTPEKIDLKV